ncbi:alpha-amylase family glycosyl hydrolase [Peribacillus frigoritolerans]|nr:alpha-amylase family glycosyl hydrolase [Peribacillus frigoritolerans]
MSKFGGPAWEYVAEHDEYFLHLFDRTQADLNWEKSQSKAGDFQCSKLLDG